MWIEKINQEKKQMYLANNKIDKIVAGGDMSGLEVLVQQGRWEECLGLAEKQGPDFLNTYLMRFSKAHLQQGQFKETARVLTRFGVPAIPQMLSVYKTITIEVLATINEIEMQILREMLQKLVKNLEAGAKNTHYHEFHKYLMVVHLLLLKGECGRKNLPRVASALATSLLRYTKDIRADQAFLDAGNATRKSGANDMAYIFFNRYIDLYDAIEDPENNGISDNQDFEDTDIPSPYEIALPEKNLLSATERDEIRDWVLEVNMDGTEKSLPTRCCEYCQFDGLYEASLHCPQCNSGWEPCIVSGYPLVKANSISCKFCNMGALRDHWNDYIDVFQNCPWCNSMQTQY
jgi:intraflagellar transport protein 172